MTPSPAMTSTAHAPLSTDSTIAVDEMQGRSEDVTHKSESALPTTDLEKGSKDDTPIPVANGAFLVEFEGSTDPGNPKSWTPKRRWGITISMGLMVFTVTFASSIFSVNIGEVQEKFNVEKITATLGVALFVLVCWTSRPMITTAANTTPRALYSDLSHSAPCQKS
jgi:DHA1 family multidrug resistance protein-like MFS transporter